jgi:hypothetical protein
MNLHASCCSAPAPSRPGGPPAPCPTGPASLLVIRGQVRLVAGDDSIQLAAHQFSPIPNRRHSLHADDDSVVMLSVAVPERAPMAD